MAKNPIPVSMPGSGETRVIQVTSQDTLRFDGINFQSIKIDIAGSDIIFTDPATQAKIIFPQLALLMFSASDAPQLIDGSGQAMDPQAMFAHVGFVNNMTEADYVAVTSLKLAEKDEQPTSQKAQATPAEPITEAPPAASQPQHQEDQKHKFKEDAEPQDLLNTIYQDPPSPFVSMESGGGTPRPPANNNTGRVDADAGATFTFNAQLVQLTATSTVSGGVMTVLGGGGSREAAYNGQNSVQYQSEVIDTTRHAGAVVIHADNSTYFNDTVNTRVLQMIPTFPDGFEPSNVTVSGLPAGFVVEGATLSGGVWTVTNPTLNSNGTLDLPITYPVSASAPFVLDIRFESVFNPSSPDATSTPAVGSMTYNLSQLIEMRQVNSPADGNYTNGGGQPVWVLAQNLNQNTIITGNGPATVYGSLVNDNITTGNGDDHIEAGTGDDVIRTGGGNDFIDGGTGNDIIDGGAGIDTATYTSRTDSISLDLSVKDPSGYSVLYVGSSEQDKIVNVERIIFGSGNDTFIGDSANNIIFGGAGDDTFTASGGTDVLDGGTGIDTLSFAGAIPVVLNLATGVATSTAGTTTFTGFENYIGSSGDDVIYDATGSANIDAGAGNDTFVIAPGDNADDVFNGGAGQDTLDFSLVSTAVTADLSAGTVTGFGNDTLISIENLTGGSGDDTLTGDAGANTLRGGAGNDRIDGGDGNDIIDGSTGNDTLLGGAGDDTLYGGTGSDTIDGGAGIDTLRFDDLATGVTLDLVNSTAFDGTSTDTFTGIERFVTTNQSDQILASASGNNVRTLGGNDTIVMAAGDTANDTFDGGDGIDTIDYSAASNAIIANLVTGQITGNGTDTVVAVENVIGSAFDDTITGDAGINVLSGGAGNDTLLGGHGDDTLNGGTGTDTLYGGLGNDTLNGGDDADILYGEEGNDILNGDAGDDSLYGGDGNDVLNGGDGNDLLEGEAGNDILNGGAGNDTLNGGAGNDTLNGGDGNDTLDGGIGNDTLDGGAGLDTVTYASRTSGISVNLGVVDAGGYSTVVLAAENESDRIRNIEVIRGSAVADVMTGGSGNDTFYGNGGADMLYGMDGDDTLDGGAGNDLLDGGAGNDTLLGGDGDDTLLGGSGNDLLDGGAGNDTLNGGEGDDVINGGDGNDILRGGAGNDAFDGGAGIDTLYADDTGGAVVLNIGAGTLTGVNGTDTFTNIEIFRASALADTITESTGSDTVYGEAGDDTFLMVAGDNSNDVFDGGAGTDTIDYTAASNAINANLATGQIIGNGTDLVNAIENVTGTTMDDTLVGNGGNNVLAGGDGNDILDGAGGNDTLLGGAGNDTIRGGTGSDVIDGGSGINTLYLDDTGAAVSVNLTTGRAVSGADTDTFTNIQRIYTGQYADTITASTGVDQVWGQDGNDTFIMVAGDTSNDSFDGGSGNDTINYAAAQNGINADLSAGIITGQGTDSVTGIENVIGTAYADTLTGDGNANLLDGGAGDDILSGGDGSDTLLGGAGNDTLDGGAGNDILNGGDGDDLLLGSSGNDTIDGGNGIDTLSYVNQAAAMTINLGVVNAAGYATATGGGKTDLIRGVEIIRGGVGGDTIIGGNGNDTFYGGDGNDLLQGGAGNDVLEGEDGNDVLQGGAGNDTLRGGAGDDTVYGGTGADVMDGGSGTDTLRFDDLSTNVTLNIGAGTANDGTSTDTFSNFEIYYLNNQNNLITESTGSETVYGLGGDDTFMMVAGDTANDTFDGGTGNDTVNYSNASNAITANLSANSITGNGNDTVLNVENVIGTAFNDTITGDAGANRLMGGDGNDVITGGAGADVMDGGAGIDTIRFDDLSGPLVLNVAAGTALSGTITDTFSNFEIYYAGAGDDVITDSNRADTIYGLDGDDTFNMVAGDTADDVFDGGNGRDTLNYAAASNAIIANLGSNTVTGNGTDTVTNFENVIGTAFNDSITGDSLDNTLDGGNGNDTLNGGAGNDTLLGGTGNDVLYGGLGNDILNGGAGIDTARFDDLTTSLVLDLRTGTAISGSDTDTLISIEQVYATNQDDSLTESTGADSIFGLDGNDTFVMVAGDASNDSFDGGSGIDTITYAAIGNGINANMVTGVVTGAGTDTITNIENLTATAFADVIRGNSGANVIDAGDGDDVVYTGGGADILSGGAGTDTLRYDDVATGVVLNLRDQTATTGASTQSLSGFEIYYTGNQSDTITESTGADTVYGLGGDDTFVMIAGDSANDTFDGGTGNDTIDYTGASNAIVADLAAGRITGNGTDAVTNIENVTGTALDDILRGDAGANILRGGAGNDVLIGGLGDDTLDGGLGIDTADYSSATSGVTVNLGTGMASGGAGNDTLTAIENVIGTNFADTLTGDGNDNVLTGGGGNDIINGGDGNDTLLGGDGNDTLNGGRGNDIVSGGEGDDLIYDDAGSDQYDGGNGTDTLSFVNRTDSVTLDLVNSQAVSGSDTDTFTGIERFVLSNLDDTVYESTGADNIQGAAGDDTFMINAADTANDVFDGGSGTDTVNYSAISQAMNINLASGVATGAGTDTLVSIENIVGGSGNDTLTGNDADNVIMGGAGDDTIIGGLGNDTLDGGSGTDTVSYLTSTGAISLDIANNSVSGAAGNDTISNFEIYVGSNFADTLRGGTGNDTIYGMGGNDFIEGGQGNDIIDGGDGNDELNGNEGNDTIYGGAGNDIISGGAGNDTIYGGDGNDTIQGGSGSDTIDGGAGTDTLQYWNEGAVNINLSTGRATTGSDVDTFVNIERFRLSYNNDTITESTGADTVYGESGNDTFIMVAGDNSNDFFDGGSGIDSLDYSNVDRGMNINLATNTATGSGTDTINNFENVTGTAFDDIIVGNGSNNILRGGAGNDVIYTGGGVDTIDGGAGTDTLRYDDGGAISLNLTTGKAYDGTNTDSFSNIEIFYGSNSGDTITDSNGADTVYGLNGNDTFNLVTDSANDYFDGGAGTDTLNYAAVGNAVNVNLATGVATGNGTDTILNFENVTGTNFNDTITGDANANVLNGGAGSDTIYGGAGNDTIYGGGDNDFLYGQDGNDTIYGGGSNDTIDGGAGNDLLYGEDGNDTFIGSAGSDLLDGGAGTDVATYASLSGVRISANLTGSSHVVTKTGGGADTLVGIESIIGTSGNDSFTLDTAALGSYTLINGGTGTDWVSTSTGVLTYDGNHFAGLLDNIETLNLRNSTLATGDTFTLTGDDVVGMTDSGRSLDIIKSSSFNISVSGGSYSITSDVTSGSTRTITFNNGSHTASVDIITQ